MKKKKAGFTLIEMIIVVMIAVMVIGITTSIFMIGIKVFSDSNIKSTLQMEGQVIEEKITNIGMQAIGIELVNGNESTGEIQNIRINSYDKNGIKKSFEINKQGEKLIIDGNEVSINVESIKIDPQIIKDYNKDPNLLKSKAYINFIIKLSEKRNYNDTSIDQFINVKTVFRNREAG